MSRLKSFSKLDDKTNKTKIGIIIVLCVLFLVVTIYVYRSYAKYIFVNADIIFSNATVADYYSEELLNGSDPVITDNLVPVTIGDDGTVYKADLGRKWYKYEDKKWANAVVTRNSYDSLTSYGKVNGAIKNEGFVSFDGVDDYISLGLENYDFGTSVTMAVNLKINRITDSSQEFLGNWQVAGTGCAVDAEGYIKCSFFSTQTQAYYYLYSNDTIDINRFYTVVMTYDGAQFKVYIDGVLSGSMEANGGIKASPLNMLLGANPDIDTNIRHANVDIKQVAIFDRVISEEDIKNNFKDDIRIYNNEELLIYEDFTEELYLNNEMIPEDSIESYFVWIPKYSYQLWDLGNYDGVSTIDNTKPHSIGIRFGTTNTNDGVIGECSTPGIAGSSGNCSVGDYMTHPAFLAFDTNGLWVGKFETGYDGAITTLEAEVNQVDIDKIIVKPNVYSWRNINIGNAFKNSYDYFRDSESHMMKNTEWGAVAILSHSLYGTCKQDGAEIICSESRVNNNSSFITGYSAVEQPILSYSATSVDGNKHESISMRNDGTYTINYLNTDSIISSTTGNYSGIYDITGGSWEYVMGYTTGASLIGGDSEITTYYEDFYINSNWNKYYDKYSATLYTNYSNRILGDATGESGPFGSELDLDQYIRDKSSWYSDYSFFIHSTNPWSVRGGAYDYGIGAGFFVFHYETGRPNSRHTFRIVLAPQN